MSTQCCRLCFLGILVLGVWFFSDSVQAVDDSQKIPLDRKYQGGLTEHWKQVMIGCVDSIRRASPNSRLDAFLEGESFKYTGTEEEGVQLEKCMAQYGFPMTAMHI